MSLLFALLALAAMLLAAVALVRSVDSGALVLGNLGFKQDATSAGDSAAELARADCCPGSTSLWTAQHRLLRHLAGQSRPDRARHHGRQHSWRSSIGAIPTVARVYFPATCSSCSLMPVPRHSRSTRGRGDSALSDHEAVPVDRRRRRGECLRQTGFDRHSARPRRAVKSASAPRGDRPRRRPHRITESSCAPSGAAAP